ncbi:FtsQ-type POTRA domain-containing protein [Homoserinibacter sp. YIM 151385]|uniref:FtsQ-type POTRA domain-containing protein n=1 Tax=Homoserinibacter sp. YIM 151385 TaxID=2985506 RepID=UPI0022F00E48|nr:FtsQ-type POTRA domain-containing protein [Homoserinibacter sp. YIM 151385]WBU38737.1 FtsQ-type POTRA domain-containing protein [Homoserinibacter sp. YIM 151385]
MKRPEGFDRPAPAPPEKPARPALGRGSGLREQAERVWRSRSQRDRDAGAAEAAGSAEAGEPTTEPIAIVGPGTAGPSDQAGSSDEAGPSATAGATPARESAEPATRSAPASAREARAELRRAVRARRRAERSELRRFTRRARTRRIAWITAAGILVVFGGLIAVAVFSPLLALRTITVEGASRLDAGELERAVSDQLGTPLALLDESRIRAALGEYRLIESYATELVPPGTMIIHVVERTPIGAVRIDGGVELIDPAGVVVDTLERRPAGIPVVRVPDDGTDSPAFRAIAEVLLAMPPERRENVRTVTATTPDDVSFTMTGGRTVVWGSAERSSHKSEVLVRLIRANASRPGEYDVSAPGSAVFRARR